MNAPLIQGSKLPTFEEKEANKLKNADFQKEQDNATPEKTKEMLDKAGDLFWKNYNPDYKNDLIPEPEEDFGDPFDYFEQEESELEKDIKNRENLLENSRYYPIVERLFETEQISKDTYEKVINNIDNNLWELKIDELEITNDDENTLEWIIFNETDTERNLSDFIDDIDNIKQSVTIDTFDFEIDSNDFNSEVLNKIWKNYLKFPDNEWNFDIKKDFATAVLGTKNEILSDVQNIPLDSETFKVAIRNINSTDINKQLEWIESLYVLAYSQTEWVLWSKVLNSYKKKRKDKLKKEWKKIQEELLTAEENNNQEKLIELNKRKNEIINEMSELTWVKDWKKLESWDIFKATKLETASSNTEK